MDSDLAIRLAAFSWLTEKTAAFGDVLPRTMLQEGFIFEGTRVPFVAPNGIFKPKVLDLPLSITTTPESPYNDTFGSDGLLTYRYRGTNPNHSDNVGLRKVMGQKRPLVYLHGVISGQYLAVWPVYIVTDDPATLAFKVAVDDVANIEVQADQLLTLKENSIARRAYITALVKIRLHQRSFRERVLEAYRTQCALCHLRHRELLDAAHILPDSTPEGYPLVTNGIALCKLHHSAFDSFILGLSPDYIVHVRRDVLEEHDGPILQHGLKDLNGAKLLLPHEIQNWPNKDALSQRFEQFTRIA
jgi:putative restriction endonuclease